MYDICFDVERNAIKKRYGELTSLNTDQKCLFNFVDPAFVGSDRAVAVFKKDDEEIDIELTCSGGDYYCTFPAVLCNTYGIYSLTVIVYPLPDENSDEEEDLTRFRSTREFTGEILDSGYSDSNFAPVYPETYVDSVREGILDAIRFTSDGKYLYAEYDSDYISEVSMNENGEVIVVYEEDS